MPPAETIPAAAPGAVIADKYRVERILGRGGMGVVVGARHLDLNQELAIKVLLPSAAANPEATARFLREGRAAARLTSPHVAKVHDTGRLASGEPYLVMEMLRGRDLKAIVERGPVPFEQAIGWVLEACEALAEAHSLGIIHRDIKPSNIFLADTVAGSFVKVLDFGISKQLDAGEADLTGTMASIGTPRYMSPEQMHSSKHVDARSDIWSLGVVLYELTTGKPPFVGGSVTEIVVEVLQTEPTPPSLENPALSPAFDAIVKRCIAKRPDERFPSVPALMDALRSLLSGGAGAEGPRPNLPISADTTGNRGLVPQAAPAITPQGATPGYPQSPTQYAGPPPSDTQQSWNTPNTKKPLGPRPSKAPYVAGAVLLLVIGSGATYAILRGKIGDGAGAAASKDAATSTAIPTATARIEGPTAVAFTVIPATPTPSAQTIAQPSAVVPTPVPQPVRPAPQPRFAPPQPPPPVIPPVAAPGPNCNPPFTIGPDGNRHAKPECM